MPATNSTINMTKRVAIIILSYLTIICVIVSFNFLMSINRIFDDLSFGTIGFGFFILIFLFLTIANTIFLFREKTIKDYRLVLLYNIVLCFFSGIEIVSPSCLFVNELGFDLTVGYTHSFNQLSGFFFHYNLFNLDIRFYIAHNTTQAIALGINLVMWSLGITLIVIRKKISKLSESVTAKS